MSDTVTITAAEYSRLMRCEAAVNNAKYLMSFPSITENKNEYFEGVRDALDTVIGIADSLPDEPPGSACACGGEHNVNLA